MATSEQVAAFRGAVLDILDTIAPTTPLALSGGVDSATLLAGSLALGRRPPCYTFRLGDYDSPDVRVALSMADTCGVPLTVLSIPRTEDTLLADIREVIQLTGATRRTHVQTAQPFLRIARAVAADGHDALLAGVLADDLYGTGREAQFALRRGGESEARAYREQAFRGEGNSVHSIERATRAGGVRLLLPYRDDRLAALLLATDLRDLHRPIQKHIAVAAFPDFWHADGWYRRNSSLQVDSGVRAWHDTLLDSPLNTRGVRDVAALYRDLAKEMTP